MRIDPSERLAGLPIVEVRDLLRRRMDCDFTADAFERHSDLEPDEVERLIDELWARGYLQQSQMVQKEGMWELSPDGRRFAKATAAQPVKRETAERALEEFLERVEEFNADETFVYRCAKVVVFGSFLDPEVDRLGDVDVAIELTPRYSGEEHSRRRQQRIEEAIAGGRSFPNLVEQLGWPEREVLLFLKAGSRVISLTDISDKVLERVESEVVYDWSA